MLSKFTYVARLDQHQSLHVQRKKQFDLARPQNHLGKRKVIWYTLYNITYIIYIFIMV